MLKCINPHVQVVNRPRAGEGTLDLHLENLAMAATGLIQAGAPEPTERRQAAAGKKRSQEDANSDDQLPSGAESSSAGQSDEPSQKRQRTEASGSGINLMIYNYY